MRLDAANPDEVARHQQRDERALKENFRIDCDCFEHRALVHVAVSQIWLAHATLAERPQLPADVFWRWIQWGGMRLP